MPAALLTSFLIARWGQVRVIILGTIGMDVSLLPLGLIIHWSAAGVGYMGLSALFAMTMPAFSIFQQESVAPTWRATLSGAILMATSLGAAMMAFGGGFYLEQLGYRNLFLIGVGITFASALLLLAYIGKSKLKFETRLAPSSTQISPSHS